MNTNKPIILTLARRLIALEAANAPSEGLVSAALRTCDKLRVPLAKLVGTAGFRSLMTRALALATAELPWLKAVQVRADGSLEGIDAAGINESFDVRAAAGAAIVSHLLELLVTFIGDPLTLGFVRDAWPEATLEKMVMSEEVKS